MDAGENQIILIDKPAGISSFGVVAKVRGYLRAKYGKKVKVGHTGTLDPFATGLLILLTGKMTKRSGEFLKLDKVYEATLRLGYTSTTGDPEGEITKYIPTNDESGGVISKHCKGANSHFDNGHGRVSGTEIPGRVRLTRCENDDCEPCTSRNGTPDLSTIKSVLRPFTGKIEQTPPRYSAIKINGQRAYKLARKGADFEMPTREVEIYDIETLEYRYPELRVRCHVSSGTYIRTLAEDIGKALNTGAYLTALRRTQIANYKVADATPLSTFAQNPDVV